MILLIMGPQGSGKGTQAKLLAQRLGLFYLDVGAHLRKIAKLNPRLSEIVNKRGELVPDSEMFTIITNFLDKDKLYDNLILDGYPRSIAQYQLLTDYLAKHGSGITKAIFLRVSDEVSVKRLSARRTEPATGKIYNLLTNPPGPEVDRTKLVQREDDKPEAIAERLLHYHETTQPLVEMLKGEGRLIEINGEQPIADIEKEINAKI